MVQQLIEMDIDWLSLVDKGANRRRFHLLKRAAGSLPASRPATFGERVALAKASPAFAGLLEVDALSAWLPSALDTLGEVTKWAIGDQQGTAEQRMQAVIMAADQFRDGILERTAGAIAKREVAKRQAAASWSRGIL